MQPSPHRHPGVGGPHDVDLGRQRPAPFQVRLYCFQEPAVRLRAIAASLRGEVVDVANLEKKIGYGVSVGTAPGWGWRPQPFVWIDTNQAQIRARQQEAIEKGETTRQEIWKTIETQTADIRSRMGQKLKTAF